MSGNNEDHKKVGLQGTQLPSQDAIGMAYTTPVGLDKNIKGGSSQEYFIPHDAVFGLDQGIEPTWTGVHTFAENANFRANISLSAGENPPAATLDMDGSSLKYKVSTSAIHEFYVGDSLVGQIDDPAAPSGDNSLVSKSYVDQHGGGGSLQPGTPKNPAVSIGNAVSDGSASTYMRSDVVLGLDQNIAPQWSSAHTFLDGVNFAPSSNPGGPNATLNLDGQSLKYTVTQQAGAHEFQVGATQLQLRDLSGVAEEDIPDDALVGWGTIRQYVDGHVDAGQLSMMVSYGAPLLDPDHYSGWNPSNSVTIYGPSGMRYIVLADKQATLSDGGETYSGYLIFTMGDDKVKRLSVQMPAGVENYGTAIRCGVHSPLENTDQEVLAVLESLPPVEQSADFYPVIGIDPSLNFELIESYAYGRGVPSDGITPAQISVIVDASSSVTSLVMDVVDGDATFDVDGQETHCEPPITKPNGQPDGWVLVNVYSKSPGVSKIKITAPTVSDEIYAYPSFLLPIGT
ncbi:hypothetical protein [Phyllobacterium phragmitis]|uniref:Uncharacterized protein n=1 Tax=Phyllobacterium phragmitis TaxID=2670329 RepID=A0ABQ0H743_9HYPH